VAEAGYFHSITLRNQIHAPNLFHDSVRERKEMGFPGIDALRENQVACGQPPTHIVIELLRANVNHWEKKKFKTGAVLFQMVDGGAHVERVLFDELHTPRRIESAPRAVASEAPGVGYWREPRLLPLAVLIWRGLTLNRLRADAEPAPLRGHGQALVGRQPLLSPSRQSHERQPHQKVDRGGQNACADVIVIGRGQL